MGTASYIVEGLGNAASYESCSHGAGRRLSLLALALFEHAVAGLGEDGATAKSWLEVEPFLLFPALWVSGQSKVWLGASCLQWSGALAGARGAW